MADQIVRAVVTPLAGDAMTGTYTTQDGVSLSVGDDVLVYESSDPTQQRIYTVAAGAWSPKAGITYTPGMDIRVLESPITKAWRVSLLTPTSGTITPGTTVMTWRVESFKPALNPAVGLSDPDAEGNFSLLPRAGVLGDWDIGPLSLSVNDRGIITSIGGGYAQETYVQGLTSSYLSTTQFKVSAGVAYNYGSDDNQEIASEQTVSVSGAPVSGFLYVYLTNTGTIALSQTAPDTPYLGNARYMAGDTSRRYIGTLRTNASNQPYNFSVEAYSGGTLFVSYIENISASPFLAVNAGTATTAQSVNLGPSGLKLVPATATHAYFGVNVNATASVFMDDGSLGTMSGSNYLRRVSLSQRGDYFFMPLDSSQSFRWMNSVAGGSTDISLIGYIDRR